MGGEAEVSVVVPTFRRPGALGEALRSALAQEDVAVEVLVVDDCPDGSARPVVEALGDARVRYLHHVPSSGRRPARVRNAGWPRTSAPFVHFLDDDDRMAPGAYARMLAALEASGAGVAFGRIEPFGEDRNVLARQQRYFDDAARRARWSHAVGSRHAMVANMLFGPTVLVNSACLIRRSCLEAVGGYREEPEVVEDVDLYIRAIRHGGCAFVDEVVLHYRTGASSLMHDLADNAPVERSYRHIYDHYRRAHGRLELAALKLLARTALRWV